MDLTVIHARGITTAGTLAGAILAAEDSEAGAASAAGEVVVALEDLVDGEDGNGDHDVPTQFTAMITPITSKLSNFCQ